MDTIEKTTNNQTWALILGGSSGLGLATAKKLAQHGFNLIIIHRDRRVDLEEIAAQFDVIKTYGISVVSYNVDAVRHDKQQQLIVEISQLLSDGRKIKVLVHSIAKGSLKPMTGTIENTLSSTDISLTFEAMGLSLYQWVQKINQAQLFASDTRIIAFTSEGNTKALPHYGAVSVAKVALEALVRNIAVEFAPLGIRANCIQAGVTSTKSFAMIPNAHKIEKHAITRNPNSRLTAPEDVANAVYLLTRAEAKWITGTVIPVDGGEHLR